MIGIAALVAASCATHDTFNKEAFDKKIAVTRTALISAGDPDALAAAALLGDLRPDGAHVRLALIARATDQAPQRPELIWLQLQICHQVKTCDPEPIEANLRNVDPGNGAGWSGQLARAWERKDAAQVRKGLVAVGNSERFDIYWNPLIATTANAMVGTKTMGPSEALVDVIGVLAAQAIPAYQSLTHACQGASLEEPDTLTACRRVAAVLQRGDTYITEMIGTSIAKRVWPEGSAEYQDAVEASRVARYRIDIVAAIGARSPWNKESAAQHLRLLATHRTEQEVALAEITNAGKSPNPSAEWKDPTQERQQRH
ncbi:MAG: hypothetical protein JO184_06615 [Gammaproteobacteria bacterium]|nr:hypothetical protein [Gammaproteobacteria bacterium]